MKEITDYLLGFFACDGYLDKNEITVGLELQERDRAVLKLFCQQYGAKIEKPRIFKGRPYLRARAHSMKLWRDLKAAVGGRLKAQRVWPPNASNAFVAGCIDGDGCFHLHRGAVEGEFQHASSQFRKGFERWLKERGLRFSVRQTRPIITFGPTTCRELGKLWPDCGLTRKRDITCTPPKRDHREWLDWQLAIVSDRSLSHSEVAKKTGKTKQAVNLKRWRLSHATSAK